MLYSIFIFTVVMSVLQRLIYKGKIAMNNFYFLLLDKLYINVLISSTL
jgi:hypothetical protein